MGLVFSKLWVSLFGSREYKVRSQFALLPPRRFTQRPLGVSGGAERGWQNHDAVQNVR